MIDDYKEIKEHYIMSLTPRAAQIRYFIDDKPCMYPSTPQEEYDNPLQTYADALKPGTISWRNHEGKRDYVVVKRDFSQGGKSLLALTKSAYVWRNGIEVMISTITDEEYDECEIQYSLTEVTYENGLYIHKRPVAGFMPKEYLEHLYNEMTNRD